MANVTGIDGEGGDGESKKARWFVSNRMELRYHVGGRIVY